MAIKPMLFNTEMVRALLEGRKTVTRRVIKPQPDDKPVLIGPDSCWFKYFAIQGTEKAIQPPFCAGDVIWVRETYSQHPVRPDGKLASKNYCYYKADGDLRPVGWRDNWHPSIHMPKEFARIFLRVTDVRAERLQEMSDDKALAEGVPHEWPMPTVYCPRCKGEGMIGALHPSSLGYMDVECPYCERATIRFARLWDSTIKLADQPTYAWEANPYVWVIEFERCEKPEGWPC